MAGLIVTLPPDTVTAAVVTSMVSNTEPSAWWMVMLPVPFCTVSLKVATRLAFKATPKALSFGEKVGTSGGLLPVEKVHTGGIGDARERVAAGGVDDGGGTDQDVVEGAGGEVADRIDGEGRTVEGELG